MNPYIHMESLLALADGMDEAGIKSVTSQDVRRTAYHFGIKAGLTHDDAIRFISKMTTGGAG